MSQVKAIQRPQTESCLFWMFSYNAPKNNFLFMEDSKLGVKPIMYSFTWLDSHSKFNNMQQYEDWEVGNSVSVLTLSHSGQSIHALHDKWGGKGEEKKLNILVSEIGSICSARTDCSLLLPCWSAVKLPSLSASPFFPLLLYGTLHFFVGLAAWL